MHASLEIDEHKLFTFDIETSPIFICRFQQCFIENMTDLKKQIPNEKNWGVGMNLGWEEFCFLMTKMFEYYGELKQYGDELKTNLNLSAK